MCSSSCDRGALRVFRRPGYTRMPSTSHLANIGDFSVYHVAQDLIDGFKSGEAIIRH